MNPPSETRNVLLIEDDHGVRAMLTLFLENAGFHVLEAASSEEARRVWHNQIGMLDATVIDVVLPDGAGFDLAREFREERHDLNVIMISGGVPAPLSNCADVMECPFLSKPFAPEVLVDAISKCFAGDALHKG